MFLGGIKREHTSMNKVTEREVGAEMLFKKILTKFSEIVKAKKYLYMRFKELQTK